MLVQKAIHETKKLGLAFLYENVNKIKIRTNVSFYRTYFVSSYHLPAYFFLAFS